MKRNRIRILLLCLFLLCLSACGKSEQDAENSTGNSNFIDRLGKKGSVNKMAELPEEDPDYREKTTVMIYMIGSDLESGSAAATNDLKEMEESGVDLEQVTLLVYAGGAEQWHNDLTADKNTLLKLTKDGFQKEKDFDLMSMGDPENLSRFLSYAYENYPADRFHLLFWDHGNGPVMGYGKDMLFDGDSLTLSELRTALEKSPFGPEKKLGIIGFDACLMASVELACVTGDYADYLISSQEVEPNYGWNYTFLKKCGRTTSDWLAKQIVDDYVSYNETYNSENEFSNNDATLSVIDLSHAAELQAAVDQMFSSAVEDVSGDFNQLVKARVGTRGLGRASTGSEYDLVDLNNLSETLQTRYPDQANRLQSVLDQAVMINQSSLSDCCGLSLYYPYYNKKYYSSAWKEEYEKLNLFPNYTSYLDRYEDIWLGTDLKELYDGELVPKNGNTDQTFSLQLTDEQKNAMASCGYYILKREGGGLYWPIYASTGVQLQDNTLIAKFDGRVIYAENDLGSRYLPLIKIWNSYDGIMDLSVKGYYEPYSETGAAEWTIANYRLSVDETSGEIKVKGIYEDNFMLYDSNDEISTGKKDQIDISKYNTFGFAHTSPRYLARDEEGRILDLWDWPSQGMLEGNVLYVRDGLHFVYETLYDDGSEYYIMFDITDTQDNHVCSELLPIQLMKEEKEPPAVNEIEWNPQSEAQTIFDADGVTMELISGRNMEDGTYTLKARVTNKNVFKVRLHMDECRINDSVDVDYTHFTLDPETSEVSDLGLGEKVMTTCSFLGEVPTTLDFQLDIENIGPEGHIIHSGYYRVNHIDLSEENNVFPYYGAKAEAQVLYDEDGLVVKLEAAGCFDPSNSNPDLNASFSVENGSGKTKKVKIGNALVNGFYIGTSDGYSNPYPYELELAPGEKCYKVVKLSQNVIDRYDNDYSIDDGISPRKKVEEIYNLSYCFMIDEKEMVLPIVLSEAGTEETVQIEGTPLLQETVFQCVLDGHGKLTEDDDSKQKWYMSITNQTEHTIKIWFFDSDNNVMKQFLVGAKSTRYLCYTVKADTAGSIYPIRVRVQEDLNSDAFSEPYTMELTFD